jgi:type I restriction enzyme, S subunit
MPATFSAPAHHRVRRGDLIVSRANTAELTGAVAVAEADYPNRYLSDKLLRLVLDTERVHPDYLLYALRSPHARRHISGAASGTSDSMRNISQLALLKTPVPLPPLDEQLRRVAEVKAAFELLDEARAASRIQRTDADTLVPATLSAAFTTVPVVLSARANGNLAPLVSVARLESGHTPSRRHPEWWSGHVPWLALPDIRKLHGKVAHETVETINDAGLANSSARLLPVGTVCVSRTASIGFVTMLGRPMATSQDFCNWVCNPERLDAEYLMYAFMASQEHLRKLGSGAVHKTIYMPTIESFHIAAPTLDEQRRIARTLRGQLAAVEALQSRLAGRQAEIEQLPQRILAAAFGDA